MDQSVRNKLRNLVTQCRKLLEKSIAQQLQGTYGIHASKQAAVQVDDEARMSQLSEEDRHYRRDLLDRLENIKAPGFQPKAALDHLIREIAFTHFSRLCAYKMMEARDVDIGGQEFRQAVSRGGNSDGFKFYLADHPDDERLFNTGQQELAYRHFLDWLGGLLSQEIGVLFQPNDPANRLYPPQKTLDKVLDRLNNEDLAGIWRQEETIGWVYQYFTPKELRDQARKESQAPRNSYELAFRNQFFTPRYVVEFLTDNTLGRIWYEMRKGDTKLTDRCQYMVRRPNELFLDKGQKPPTTSPLSPGENGANPPTTSPLSTEGRGAGGEGELLKQPVYVPHRTKKDPRELKILDPACGTGHFLLYCFDVLLAIYEEAYSDADLRPALQQDYPTRDDLRRDVPRLILAHNLYGTDIDPKACQIAALALWLRCQRAYQEMGPKKERPKITRSNLVCAEPMPGDAELLEEFLQTLNDDRLAQLIRRVTHVPDDTPVRAAPETAARLCELVRLVWGKMKLAGKAGSLLAIEEELRDAIHQAQEEMEQPWAEALVMAALGDFATYAANGERLPRKLFVDDAVPGSGFVDLCRKRFDAVLMNPPFGEPPVGLNVKQQFSNISGNLLEAFIERARTLTWPAGCVGSVIDATVLTKSSYKRFRQQIASTRSELRICAWLGWDVLDTANVEVGLLVLTTGRRNPYFDCLNAKGSPENHVCNYVADAAAMANTGRLFAATPKLLDSIPNYSFPISADAVVHLNSRKLSTALARAKQGVAPVDSFRVMRLRVEVPAQSIGIEARWRTVNRGGAYCPFYRDYTDVINWENEGQQLKEEILRRYPYLNGNVAWVAKNEDYYGKPGLGYGKRTDCFSCQILPEDTIITVEGFGLYPHSDPWLTLGFLNSRIVAHVLNTFCGQHKYSGYVDNVPVPDVTEDEQDRLRTLAREGFALVRTLETRSVLSPFFKVPRLAAPSIAELRADWQTECVRSTRRLDGIVDEIDGIVARHWTSVEPSVRRTYAPDEAVMQAGHIVELLAGFVFGRWDVRFATGNRKSADFLTPFAPLPAFPPATLVHDGGVPAPEWPADYPLRIDADGILVDAAEHPNDIVRRLREAIEVIWQDRAEDIEKEACEMLGVNSLRDYFRKPGKRGFWDDHVKRYSQSRRKAPIYWLLQSSKKNFALWLYYHRLDKDMLFKALANYVEPMILREENRLGEFRSQEHSADDYTKYLSENVLPSPRLRGEGPGVRGLRIGSKEATKFDREIEKQENLLAELRDFEEKLRQVAELHLAPDLSDGVVLNIAPLRELVPWKEARKYWAQLLDGKYAWSSIGKQLREKRLGSGQ